jgi:Xaa-Pro aminopeptidase
VTVTDMWTLSDPDRLRRTAGLTAEAGLDALLVSPGPDLRYLTGYDALPLERLGPRRRRLSTYDRESAVHRSTRRRATASLRVGTASTSSTGPGTGPGTGSAWRPTRTLTS